jgi:hypothetical protein
MSIMVPTLLSSSFAQLSQDKLKSMTRAIGSSSSIQSECTVVTTRPSTESTRAPEDFSLNVLKNEGKCNEVVQKSRVSKVKLIEKHTPENVEANGASTGTSMGTLILPPSEVSEMKICTLAQNGVCEVVPNISHVMCTVTKDTHCPGLTEVQLTSVEHRTPLCPDVHVEESLTKAIVVEQIEKEDPITQTEKSIVLKRKRDIPLDVSLDEDILKEYSVDALKSWSQAKSIELPKSASKSAIIKHIIETQGKS